MTRFSPGLTRQSEHACRLSVPQHRHSQTLRSSIAEYFVSCREASSGGHELDVPQQFGVWQVTGLGIVVAFRGTASQEDVIIDANIAPVPLDSARPTRGWCLRHKDTRINPPLLELARVIKQYAASVRKSRAIAAANLVLHPLIGQRTSSKAGKGVQRQGSCMRAPMSDLPYAGRGAIKVHGGFYNGAKRHLSEIATVVRACDEKAGRRLPVWVTGHSLGGGYANALALHLLAQRNTAELFGAGQLQSIGSAANILSSWQ